MNERHDEPRKVAVAAFSPVGAMGTFSAPFRVVGSDRNDYFFVKALDNSPPGQEATLAAEVVVAGVGRIIGAPVCRTAIIEIPEALAGYEPRPGTPVRAGLAHASVALEHADEMGRPSLYARQQDDNQVRHVGCYALFDWCYGSDQQWLYDLDDDRRLYSHDHGLYLPPNWYVDSASLVATVDEAHVLPDSPVGLQDAAVIATADRIQAVTREQLASILNSVPASWPVTDKVLDTLGWYLEQRAPAVADRLRQLLGP